MKSLDESKRQFHIAFLLVVLTLYVFLVLTFDADIFCQLCQSSSSTFVASIVSPFLKFSPVQNLDNLCVECFWVLLFEEMVL